MIVDIGRRRRPPPAQVPARAHGFDYEQESAEIVDRWKRGVVMSTVGGVTARNVVLSGRRGEASTSSTSRTSPPSSPCTAKVGTDIVMDLRFSRQGATGERRLAARGH